ncbi:MAG: DUF1702 family protein [Cyanobacteriota bacterium]|nr:DUF1702 family protein [Cyanobacteriota bacterium]
MSQTLIPTPTGNSTSKNKLTFSLLSLRQFLFSISPEEATFARRGFSSSDARTRQQLEQVGRTFLQGYHAAIAQPQPDLLVPQLNTIPLEWRGFAFEGAGMGLALLDKLTPWRCDRIQTFLNGEGNAHTYMVHVGIGWAIARLPFSIPKALAQLDPLLGWLAIDGYGFHQGYFYWQDYIERFAMPQKLSGYASCAFDQGLGRSIWFVRGADIPRIAQTIQQFHPGRRADLWSGVGLACTYAGGVEKDAIAALQTAAVGYQPQLSQGATFAAKARARAGNLTAHTEMVCQMLCGMSATAAAEITDRALENLPLMVPDNRTSPAYEIWRKRIQAQFGE